MCAVSAIYDMFGKQPDSWYTIQRIDLFRSMVTDARVFDAESGQPDCEDPEKAKFEERIAELEQRFINLWSDCRRQRVETRSHQPRADGNSPFPLKRTG